MFRLVSANLKVIVVAAITAMVTAGGPPALAAAYDAMNARYAGNADKVDGRHAVAAATSIEDRKGKLVATNVTTGQLPNNIIAKALDANKLDGLDSTALTRKEQIRHVSVSAGGDALMKSDAAIKVTHVDGSGLYSVTMPNHSNCVVSTTMVGAEFGFSAVEFSDDPAIGFLVRTGTPAGALADRDFDLLAFCRA